MKEHSRFLLVSLRFFLSRRFIPFSRLYVSLIRILYGIYARDGCLLHQRTSSTCHTSLNIQLLSDELKEN